MPHRRPFSARTLLVLVTLLLTVNASAEATSVEAVSSRQLKSRVRLLEIDEQYLAAFALSVERLKLNVPPTDINRDEFIDALTDVVVETQFAGQTALADELSRVLISECTNFFGEDARTAKAYRIQGGFARTQWRVDDAWKSFDESRCILESIGESHSEEYARYLWGLGNWYRWSDQRASLAYLSLAKEMRDEVNPGVSRDAADAAAWVAWTMLHLGKHAEARVMFERARAMFVELGLDDSATLGTVLAGLGDLSALEEDWPTAESLYRGATGCFEAAWAKRGATTRNIPLHGYQLIAYCRLRQGKPDDAWRSLERYRAGQALRASVSAASWRVQGDPAYDRVRRLNDELLQNRASARALHEAPCITSATWSALIHQLELAARCTRAETDYARAHPIPNVSLGSLQSRLDDGTAYVGWLDARIADDMHVSSGPFLEARWMYAIARTGRVEWKRVFEIRTRDDFARVRLPERDFHAIIQRATAWRERVDVDPDLIALSKQEYHVVFGPGEFDLSGINRLVAEVACYDEWIHTDDLIDPNGRYVSERYSVSYSPSAAIYVALSESKTRRDLHPSVLAVGDPVFSLAQASRPRSADGHIDDVVFRGAISRDPAALDRLPRLPYAGRELDRIQTIFPGSRVLRGTEASELSIDRLVSNNELKDYDIVHLASHALVDLAPERCAIALSRSGIDGSARNDGLIDAPEIRTSWKLDADLVTLSACQTAGLGFHRGEPVGFSQALFQAGARCVLLSFWKVDDEATSLLMSRFYENVAACQARKSRVSYSDALVEAKNWLRNYTDANGRRPFAHPVYWAGFALIGDAD